MFQGFLTVKVHKNLLNEQITLSTYIFQVHRPGYFASLLRETSKAVTVLPRILMHNSRVGKRAWCYRSQQKPEINNSVRLWDSFILCPLRPNLLLQELKKKEKQRGSGEGVGKLGWVKLHPVAIVRSCWYPYALSHALAFRSRTNTLAHTSF